MSVTETLFQELFRAELGEHYDRALAIFHNYGPNLQGALMAVFVHLSERQRVPETLAVLEMHYEAWLKEQSVSARGLLPNETGINPTEVLFAELVRILIFRADLLE